jgi:hypothetical protein
VAGYRDHGNEHPTSKNVRIPEEDNRLSVFHDNFCSMELLKTARPPQTPSHFLIFEIHVCLLRRDFSSAFTFTTGTGLYAYANSETVLNVILFPFSALFVLVETNFYFIYTHARCYTFTCIIHFYNILVLRILLLGFMLSKVLFPFWCLFCMFLPITVAERYKAWTVSLKHWDRGFESYTEYRYFRSFIPTLCCSVCR